MLIKSAVIATVCVVALGLGTAGAMAAGGFQEADENRDGKVSWDEAFGHSPSLSRVLFDAADATHDGSLDETEYESLFALSCGTK